MLLAKWNREGWKKTENNREKSGEGKERRDKREKRVAGKVKRWMREAEIQRERNAQLWEDPSSWKVTNDDDVSVQGGSIASCYREIDTLIYTHPQNETDVLPCDAY